MGYRDRVWPSVWRRVHQAVAGGGLCLDGERGWRSGDAGASLPGLQNESIRKGLEKNICLVVSVSPHALHLLSGIVYPFFDFTAY